MSVEFDRFDLVRPLIDAALAEDVGSGDATTLTTVPASARGRGGDPGQGGGGSLRAGGGAGGFRAGRSGDRVRGRRRRRRRRRSPGQVVARITGARPRPPDRRAHGAQLPPASLRHRHRHASRRRRAGRHRRARPGHPQDRSRMRLLAGEVRRALRRGREPPSGPLRHDPHQRESHRRLGCDRDGGPSSA